MVVVHNEPTADGVVIKKIDRDQPAAWCLRAYCHYGLGGEDNVSQSIRDFQKVLDDIPEEAEDHPWFAWRGYAAESLAEVKHWAALEEKSVSFPDTTLPGDWVPDQSKKVTIKVDEGMLRFAGRARGDGSMDDETVSLINQDLFRRESLEEVTFKLRIPPKRGGSAANNVTFGIQVVSGGKRRQKSKTPGVGLFYDKGWMAFRAGGGQKKAFQDGAVHREGDDIEKRMWPEAEWLDIRIARLDADKGVMAIYVNGEEVFKDSISGFRSSRGKAALVLSGWSNDQEDFDVTVKDIRVVRRTR